MEQKKWIFYGVFLGAFINITNTLFSRLIEFISIGLNLPFWSILPMQAVWLLIILYIVFFRVKVFPKLKWWHIAILVIISALYALLPYSSEIMSDEYFDANKEIMANVLAIRSTLNFSIVLFALIRYFNLKKGKLE